MRKIILIAILLMVALPSLALMATPLTADKPVAFNFTNETDTLTIEIEHPGDRYLAVETGFSSIDASAAIKIVGENVITAGPVTWNNNFERELFAHDASPGAMETYHYPCLRTGKRPVKTYRSWRDQQN